MNNQRKGFTLIELLVVIAIIAILAAILFPVFAKAREKARQTTCASNQKQIALGIIQYQQDYDENFPCATQYADGATSASAFGAIAWWPRVVYPYIKSWGVFSCPDDPFDYTAPYDATMAAITARGSVAADGNVCEATPASCTAAYDYSRCSYGLNIGINGGNDSTPLKLAQVNSPADTILTTEGWYTNAGIVVIDGIQGGGNYAPDAGTVGATASTGYSGSWWSSSDQPFTGTSFPTKKRAPNTGTATGVHAGLAIARHTDGINASFTDGHVKWMKFARAMVPPSTVTAANWSLWHPMAP